MGLLSNIFAQARNLSSRRASAIEPRTTEVEESRTRRFHSAPTKVAASSTPADPAPADSVAVRPTLLEDGSHPYYPGTAFDKLELGRTIDDACKPRASMCPPKRPRVFKRKCRPLTCSSPPTVFLPPYLGSLEPDPNTMRCRRMQV